MSKQEQLEKKVADTKAAYSDASAAYAAADTKAALYGYIDYAALAAYKDAGAAYVQAMDELKEYKEQANE
jgi:hypothetical protein